MTRAELVAEVRRLADEIAGLAAEVRRGDVAVGLLGQVRDFGHRLPPGLAADIRRVVDDMVATRHEAHGEPSCSPRPGTSSAGGSGQRPPAAPSTETRQAAQDGQSGSGGDATDGVPAHQPTPQVGDVWEYPPTYARARITKEKCPDNLFPWSGETVPEPEEIGLDPIGDEWRLVERDGKPYPPAQEPEPVAVEPATDAQITAWELEGTEGTRPGTDALIARADRAGLLAEHRLRVIKDVCRERDEAVARAEKAEAALARAERVTDAERDALQRRIDAVREWAESMPDAYPESLLAADEEHGARIYASGMCNAAAMVLEILGDGEAGDE